MKQKLLLCIALIFSLSSAYSQISNIKQAQESLDTNGEVNFIFRAESEAQFHEIIEFLSISHKHVDRNKLEVEAYANPQTFDRFLQYGLDFEVISSKPDFDPHASSSNRSTQAWDTTWDAYPTYSEYVAKMNYFATTYPSICTLQNIGTTVNGRSLFVLKISDNASTDEAEPEFFYSSTMHGDELAGFPLMIRLIDYLLTNYGSDAEVDSLVNNLEIFICPNANPDGSYDGGNSNIISSPTRANANGQDLNRNYPDNQNIGRINGNGGNTSRLHFDSTNNHYEPETEAFMKFEASRNIVLAANFHGGIELVNYPYDNTYSQHVDHDYYEYISVEYADNVHNTPGVPGNYMTVDYDAGINTSPGVTNGAQWYVVYGGRQDYMNYFRHSKEVTIELSDTKFLPGNQLPNHWDWNKQAFLDYMKQANYGIQGIVTDESGNPVEAKVTISTHDDFNLNTWVSSDPLHGDYYRLIEAGSYNVTYEAPGYTPQTIGVSITNNTTTVQDVTLVATTPNPVASDATICEGDTAGLTATGTGTLNWYANVDDDTPVYTGANFTTPALSSTTSYFVEEVISRPNVGETGNTSNGGFFAGGETDRYLIFDCTESVQLKSVEINAQQAGEIEVQLQDSAGNMIDSRVILVESAGIQEITLDFIVPVANDLRLASAEMSVGFNLWRNNSGAGTNYPYSNGPITIKNSNVDTNYYYFFYDWKIAPIKSAREEVVVTVEPLPVANFSHVVNPTNNGEVTFTNTSTDADTYSWDFGDGVGSSTAVNPVYTYAATGLYDVVLTSTDPSCGTDQVTIQVDVTVETLGLNDDSLETLVIYPNPFNSDLTIALPNGFNPADMTTALYDIRGRLINTEFKSSNNDLQLSNLGLLSTGTYLLKIEDSSTGESLVRRLIKQ
ncbi:MAG: carboxypeptidase regulatory-like domain-containing protein [Bacteroidia bacterium]|nr:carboxypeptidase regulatory-like domain-containing protein [Bacteroidia bacterium]